MATSKSKKKKSDPLKVEKLLLLTLLSALVLSFAAYLYLEIQRSGGPEVTNEVTSKERQEQTDAAQE